MTPAEMIAIRKSIGLTQSGLAGKLGMSTRAINTIERGSGDVRTVIALAVKQVAVNHGSEVLS